MGSKTPQGDYQGPPNGSSASAAIADVNPPKSATASGLLPGTLGGESENGDDDDDEDNSLGASLNVDGEPVNGKKKKRKNKKKKSKAAKSQQTAPPRKALADLTKNDTYPPGEIVEYACMSENLQRTTAEEIRHQAAMEKMDADFMRDYRKAAETHRQVRQYVQTITKPGVSMSKLVQEIEDGVRALVGHDGLKTGDGLKAGLGFPTGLALNNVAAHWTPNPGSKEVILQHDDVLKIDFGVHVNGRIVDSAFTVAANPVYDNLLAAVRAATNTGIQHSGPDARISEISAAIQETMESYEIELKGKTVPVKAIRGLTGHDILRYKIHGSKQVPFVASKNPSSQRMEEGDVFAIETFGSTGSGHIRDDHSLGVYGYGRNADADTSLQLASAKTLLKTIDANFGTLVFSRRQLEHLRVKSYHLGMKSLIEQGIVHDYDPLVDIPGSYVAQFEHTILLKPSGKEIISRGDDY